MDFDADLKKLVADSDDTINLVPLPRPDPASISRPPETPSEPVELARFSRQHMTHWRIQSFTGLTRGVHQPAQMGTVSSQADPILDFPAGSHIGIMIHSLLENLDFQLNIEAQCEQLFPRYLPASGIAVENYQQALIRWLEYIVQTSLDGDELCLNALTNRQRLNELCFDFALDHLNIENLNQQLQSLSPVPLKALSSMEFSGMINGVIDLVFEYQGRYFLADYKSNFLGASLEDYRPEQLGQAMLHRRYDLQSMIYSIALHRFLDQRIADYDYERHFGGSYYLFLRAMRPEHGMRYGVHFDRPDYETFLALEQLFEFTAAGAVNA
jgi:exodeoxyribonuclease V beta subunit